MLRIIGIVALVAYFIFVVPVVMIGVGMSGGSVLSPQGLLSDLVNLDPAIFLRILAWVVVLSLLGGLIYPIALVFKRIRRSQPY